MNQVPQYAQIKFSSRYYLVGLMIFWWYLGLNPAMLLDTCLIPA